MPATQGKPGNRRMKRRATTLPGLITFRNLRLQLPCTIADLSVTGARLNLWPAGRSVIGNLDDLPDEMVLVMRADRMQVACEVRWRRQDSLGVRFLGPPQPLAR